MLPGIRICKILEINVYDLLHLHLIKKLLGTCRINS